MKLSKKKMQWLKEHLEAQMTDVEDQLWDRYERNGLDNFIKDSSSEETFALGWELGHIEMIAEVLELIDTLENPVYGDV